MVPCQHPPRIGKKIKQYHRKFQNRSPIGPLPLSQQTTRPGAIPLLMEVAMNMPIAASIQSNKLSFNFAHEWPYFVARNV
jgi:hypothetical protein